MRSFRYFMKHIICIISVILSLSICKSAENNKLKIQSSVFAVIDINSNKRNMLQTIIDKHLSSREEYNRKYTIVEKDNKIYAIFAKGEPKPERQKFVIFKNNLKNVTFNFENVIDKLRTFIIANPMYKLENIVESADIINIIFNRNIVLNYNILDHLNNEDVINREIIELNEKIINLIETNCAV